MTEKAVSHDSPSPGSDWASPERAESPSAHVSGLRPIAARAVFAAAVLLAIAGGIVWLVRLPEPRRVTVSPPAPSTAAGTLTGSAEETGGVSLAGAAAAQDQAQVPVGLLDLNTATLEQLTALPAIGDARARQIIQFRQASGTIARVEDLLTIDGIGPATVDAIRPHVSLP